MIDYKFPSRQPIVDMERSKFPRILKRMFKRADIGMIAVGTKLPPKAVEVLMSSVGV